MGIHWNSWSLLLLAFMRTCCMLVMCEKQSWVYIVCIPTYSCGYTLEQLESSVTSFYEDLLYGSYV